MVFGKLGWRARLMITCATPRMPSSLSDAAS